MRGFVSGMLVAAVLLTATPAHATAAPAGFYESRVLEPAASYVAGKPATVYCALNTSTWSQYVQQTHGGRLVGVGGTTFPGTDVSRLAPQICAPLRAQLRGKKTDVYELAIAIVTLTHEAIHQRGERDEGATECAAMHEAPGVATRFFKVRPGKNLRALMAQAWYFHKNVLSDAYRTVC